MLLPFYFRFNSYNDIRVSKVYLLVGMTFVSLMLFGCDRPKTILAIPLVGAAGLVQFNQNDFYSDAGIEQMLAMLAGIALAWQLISRPLEWTKLRIYLILTNFLTCFFVVLNVFDINPYNIHGPSLPYPVGPLGQQTLSGALIAITLPALFSGIGWFCIPAALAGLYYCGSAMAWGAALVGACAFIFLKIKKTVSAWLTLPLIATFTTFIYLTPSFFAPHGRLEIWRGVFKLKNFSLMEIIFGKGLGDFWDNFHNKYFMTFIDDRMVRHAHSEPIQLFWELGIVGVVIAAVLLCPVVKDWRYKNEFVLSGFAAMMANSFGNFTFHIAPLALIGVLYYSMSLRRVD